MAVPLEFEKPFDCHRRCRICHCHLAAHRTQYRTSDQSLSACSICVRRKRREVHMIGPILVPLNRCDNDDTDSDAEYLQGQLHGRRDCSSRCNWRSRLRDQARLGLDCAPTLGAKSRSLTDRRSAFRTEVRAALGITFSKRHYTLLWLNPTQDGLALRPHFVMWQHKTSLRYELKITMCFVR